MRKTYILAGHLLMGIAVIDMWIVVQAVRTGAPGAALLSALAMAAALMASRMWYIGSKM